MPSGHQSPAEPPRLSDSEWTCVYLIHRFGPSTAFEVYRNFQKLFAPSSTPINKRTIRTFLARAASKGFVLVSDDKPPARYSLAEPFERLLDEEIHRFINDRLFRDPEALRRLSTLAASS